ncbi:hypothetical protein PENSPDRAFT_501083 [Peniophora sp. CONT]|nr:hypothetical protein PENSPDRAFT_501083 [Peniophora sp. CONT]
MSDGSFSMHVFLISGSIRSSDPVRRTGVRRRRLRLLAIAPYARPPRVALPHYRNSHMNTQPTNSSTFNQPSFILTSDRFVLLHYVFLVFIRNHVRSESRRGPLNPTFPVCQSTC